MLAHELGHSFYRQVNRLFNKLFIEFEIELYHESNTIKLYILSESIEIAGE